MKAQVYWIPGPWAGHLGILPRPRGGDWLGDEVRAWKAAGIAVVVSALTKDEAAEWELEQEPELSRAAGLELVSFPMPDRGTPTSRKAAVDLVRSLETVLGTGKGVGIHCRQGVGRSALLAASLLAAGGVDPDSAFARIAAARGCPVPDTPEQRDWVVHFARDLVNATANG